MFFKEKIFFLSDLRRVEDKKGRELSFWWVGMHNYLLKYCLFRIFTSFNYDLRWKYENMTPFADFILNLFVLQNINTIEMYSIPQKST